MDQLELLSKLLEENYEHARLHEEQRASVTNFAMAIAAGLLGIASQAMSQWISTFFGAMVTLAGVIGALLVLKHYERYRHQLAIAAIVRDEIESVIQGERAHARPYKDLRELALQRHNADEVFSKAASEDTESTSLDSWIKEMRLHSLYLSANLLVIVGGLIFIVVVWTK